MSVLESGTGCYGGVPRLCQASARRYLRGSASRPSLPIPRVRSAASDQQALLALSALGTSVAASSSSKSILAIRVVGTAYPRQAINARMQQSGPSATKGPKLLSKT